MSPIENVVIAAAGLGSRLGLGKPKCLAEINGEPLIKHLLGLLTDVKNVHLVVGFMEDLIISEVTKIRSDVLFVRNDCYQSSNTIESYSMGAKYMSGDCIYLDADILFEPESFKNFLNNSEKSNDVLIGYTDAKTEDAVFVGIADATQELLSFSREKVSDWEWANIVKAPAKYFDGQKGSVFEFLQENLPKKAQYVNSFEIDRPEELKRGSAFFNEFCV